MFGSIIFTLLSSICFSGLVHGQQDGDKNYLRVALYNISSDNHLILIGIDRSIEADSSITTINAADAGFQAVENQDISHLDPKFLIMESRAGIQQVYSFDLGKIKKDHGSTPVANMPKMLLDVQKLKQQLLTYDGPKKALEIVQLLLGNIYVHGGEAASAVFLDRGEKDRRGAAIYLEGLISNALDTDNFSNLRNAIADPSWKIKLEDLGAALIVRYQLASIPKGIVQTQAKRIFYYRTLRAKKLDHSSRQLDHLNMLASRACLTTATLTPYLGMVFYNRLTYDACASGKAPYDPHRLDLPNPKNLSSQISDIPSDAGNLVPLATYVLDGQNMFVQLVDLNNPDKNKNRNLLKDFEEVVVSAGLIIEPLPFSILISLADEGILFLVERKGSTIYKQRLEGYAEMLMILETGIAQVNIEGFVKETLVSQAEKDGADQNLIESYKKGLESSDPQVVERTTEEMMVFFETREQGLIKHAGEKNIVKANQTRNNHWKNFIQYISDPKRLAKLDMALNNRTKVIEARKMEQLRDHPEWVDNGVFVGPDLNRPALTEVSDIIKRPPTNLPRPVIILMVDGLRPDRVKIAADRGLIPTIKKNFLDKGVQLNTYSTYAVDIPSWGTILSGEEPDRTGVRGSSTASRDRNKKWESLVGKPTRVYKRFFQTQVKPVQDYLNANETLVRTSPIANVAASVPVTETIKQIYKQFQKIAFDTFSMDAAIDLSTGVQVAKDIRKSAGQYHLVMAWFGAVDHSSHTDNHSLFDSYKAVDAGIEEILKAAKEDPVLKDAVLVLLSDHGESGGEELADPSRHDLPQAHFLSNTSFNTLHFFTGDLSGASEKYNFVVSGNKASEPILDTGPIGAPMKNILLPYSFTYSGIRKNPGRPGFQHNTTMLMEPYGDDVAHVYFLEDAKRNPAQRLSYYELTHYTKTRKNETANIPEDLLSYSLLNINPQGSLKDDLKKINGLRPVGLVAIPLQGENAMKSSIALTGGDGGKTVTRDPIVVRAYGNKAALILTHDEGIGQFYFRYTVIRGFAQNPDGTVTGQVSQDPADDPFGYGAMGVQWNPSDWKTDRQWLKLVEHTDFPTGIFGVVHQISLAPVNQKISDLTAETPDMALIANLGFTFNSYEMHEGDNGGLTPTEVRTSFFISDNEMPARPIELREPILTRDVGATILDYLGKASDAKNISGRSIKPAVDSALGEPPLEFAADISR